MKSKADNCTNPRGRRSGRTTAKGREIVASLAEAIQAERAGVPLESRFTVRTAELPEPASV